MEIVAADSYANLAAAHGLTAGVNDASPNAITLAIPRQGHAAPFGRLRAVR